MEETSERFFNKSIAALRAEGVALRFVCGVLLAELSALTSDPQISLDRITAGLAGAAQRLAEGSADLETGRVEFTRVIESIRDGAEAQLRQIVGRSQ